MPNRQERGKFSARTIRQKKRNEAELRNMKTHPDNRRVHWKAQGFSRKSVAARLIRDTVQEANAIADALREKTGLPDWRPLHVLTESK